MYKGARKVVLSKFYGLFTNHTKILQIKINMLQSSICD